MTHSNVLDDRAAGAASHPGAGPVVVALKPFDGGDSAIALGRWLAARTHSELHAMSVVEMGDVGTMVAGLPPLPESYYAQEREEVADDLRTRLATLDGEPAVRVDVVEGPPGSTVASIATVRQASTIVVGTGQHGMLGRFLYGERALDVVRTAACPVLIAPPDAEPPIQRAIVAVDFSASSTRAATYALEMLGEGGRLTLVHVVSAPRHPEGRARGVEEECDRRLHARLVRFVDALPTSSGVRLDTAVLRGDAAGALLRYADEQEVDLIACGRGRHSLVQRLFVGSVSTALIRGAPCCVLVAPWLHENDDVNGRLQFGGAGEPDVAGSQLTHRVTAVRQIETVTEPDGRDTRIAFRTRSGDCLLDFVDG